MILNDFWRIFEDFEGFFGILKFKIGKNAIAEARSLNSTAKEGEIIRLYGDFFYYTNDIKRAKVYYAEAKVLALKENNIHVYIIIHRIELIN